LSLGIAPELIFFWQPEHSFLGLKTNRGCHWFKERDFLYRHRRQICHVHMTVRKIRDQAQRLVDAFGKLISRLLQSARINRSHTAQEKSIIDCASGSKDF
jgi:hypothetical protein